MLWLRCWVPLVGWFSLGYGINELAGHVSTLLVGQKVIGTTIIVFGIVAWVACLVLAIHGLGPALHAVSGPEDTAVAALAASLGPFIAVYGAWGLAEEQFARLIQANLMTHRIDAEQFSVNAADWPFFLGFALAAWLVRLLFRLCRGGSAHGCCCSPGCSPTAPGCSPRSSCCANGWVAASTG